MILFHRLNRRSPNGPKLRFVVSELKLITCEDIITLDATLLGDADGHTFMWEQQSGPSITWLESRLQVTTTFQFATGVRSDSIFRFWVDKGTINEGYADLLITAIPRDTLVDAPVSSSSFSWNPMAAIAYTFPVTPSYDDYANLVLPTTLNLTWGVPGEFDPSTVSYSVEVFDHPTMLWGVPVDTSTNTRVVDAGSTIRITPRDKLRVGPATVISNPVVINSFVESHDIVRERLTGSLYFLASVNPPTVTAYLSTDTLNEFILGSHSLSVNVSPPTVSTYLSTDTLNEFILGSSSVSITVSPLSGISLG